MTFCNPFNGQSIKRIPSRARLFDDGQFFTESGKAQFLAIEPRPPANLPDKITR